MLLYYRFYFLTVLLGGFWTKLFILQKKSSDKNYNKHSVNVSGNLELTSNDGNVSLKIFEMEFQRS